jgi:hypothetical protein
MRLQRDSQESKQNCERGMKLHWDTSSHMANI